MSFSLTRNIPFARNASLGRFFNNQPSKKQIVRNFSTKPSRSKDKPVKSNSFSTQLLQNEHKIMYKPPTKIVQGKSSNGKICPKVIKVAQLFQDALLDSAVLEEMNEAAKTRAKAIVSIDDTSHIKIKHLKDIERIKPLLNHFMSQITKKQDVSGYSEHVDRFFQTSVTLEVWREEDDDNDNCAKMVGGMDIVSSNSIGTPIVTLPTTITYANGTVVNYENGLKNNEKDFNSFKTFYKTHDQYWGEGRLFFCDPKNVFELMVQGIEMVSLKELSGVFALAEPGSPMVSVLEKFFFKEAPKGNSNAIDTVSFPGGVIGEGENKLLVPPYTSRGNLKAYKVYHLSNEDAQTFLRGRLGDEENSLKKFVNSLNVEVLHA